MNWKPVLAMVVLLVLVTALLASIGLFVLQMGWFN